MCSITRSATASRVSCWHRRQDGGVTGEQGGRDRGRLEERVIYGGTGIPRIWLPPLCGEEGGGGGGFGSEDIGLLVKGKPFVGDFRPLVSVTGACKE